MRQRRYEDAVAVEWRAATGPGSPHERPDSAARIPALDRALLLTHSLARENSVAAVWDALAAHGAGVMRGWAAVCMVVDGNGSYRRYGVGAPMAELTDPDPIKADDWGGPFTAALLHRDAALRGALAHEGVRRLFEDPNVRRVACITIGERGMIAVMERRAEREFVPDDWFRLRAIAQHADATLERIDLSRRRRRQAP